MKLLTTIWMGALLVGTLGESMPKLRRINLHYWEECVKDNHLDIIPLGMNAFATWEKICGPLDVSEMAKEGWEEEFARRAAMGMNEYQIRNFSQSEVDAWKK